MKLQTRIYYYTIALVLCLLLAFTSCRKSLYDLPYPSEITKSHRESIGAYISVQLLEHQEFDITAQTTYNESAFDLIQQLYNQVTNTMRLDYKSPDSNRWTSNRQWRINILDERSQIAFVLPGGDLYISKGLLRKLTSEAELYSILCTEAILMNEKYLLNEMITAYSTRTLVQMAEGEQITESLPMFKYDLDTAEEIKTKVANLICTTSIYNPDVVQHVLDRLSRTDQWLQTRPLGLSSTTKQVCGTLESRGLYHSMVLDVL